MRMEILLYDGFDDMDAFAPNEVLRRAAAGGADLTVDYVTVGDTADAMLVTSAYGARVLVERRLGRSGWPDVLLIPGGGWVARSAVGARAEVERGELPAAIARAAREGAVVATVCTGAMLAAAAGLTSGRHAVTHRGAIPDLRAAGAEVIEARVVDDGDLISSGGVTSGLDLALWLVERFFGAPLAGAIERQMEYERRGVVWRQP